MSSLYTDSNPYYINTTAHSQYLPPIGLESSLAVNINSANNPYNEPPNEQSTSTLFNQVESSVSDAITPTTATTTSSESIVREEI